MMRILVFGLATAAAPAVAQQAQAGQALTDASDVQGNTVTVQNNLMVPITIFLDYGDLDRRIGTVAAQSTGTLPLPEFALKTLPTLQLYAKVERGFSLETHGFKVVPEMKVGWVVGKDIPSKSAGDTIKVVVPAPAFAATTLTVDNEREVMATVFAEEDGKFSVKLGWVAPHGHATMSIPQALVSSSQSVRVVVHPEGESDMEPQVLELGSGGDIGVRIPAKAE